MADGGVRKKEKKAGCFYTEKILFPRFPQEFELGPVDVVRD